MLHRVQSSSAFPSAHVFPGGVVEEQDGQLPESGLERYLDSPAYRHAAVRELFEESGILLMRHHESMALVAQTIGKQDIENGRRDVHSGKLSFRSWIEHLSNESPSKSSLQWMLDTGRPT